MILTGLRVILLDFGPLYGATHRAHLVLNRRL